MAWRETLVLSFILMCGSIKCQMDGPTSEVNRHLCRNSSWLHDCIFSNVFIDNLNNNILFGHAEKQSNNQTRLTFENSTLKTLPKSLVDAFTNVKDLNLYKLQIETIEPNALAKGGKMKSLFLGYNNIASLDAGVFANLFALEDLYLCYNKIASLDAGVFDDLHSVERIILDENSLSSLPSNLFWYTTNLQMLSVMWNNLHRIEDGTFQRNAKLEVIYMQSNSLVHFDLSIVPSLKKVYLENNLFQELKIPGGIDFIDASQNHISSIVPQSGPYFMDWLILSHNKLNNTAWVKPFTKLRALILSFNYIEDITSADFEQLTELHTLKLNNNRLFSFNMQNSLSRSLKALDLSHNNLVYLENNLDQFQHMVELYLDHNSIVTVNLETLTKLSNLTLSHNDWDCGSLDNVFSRFPATTVMDYGTETKCKQHYKLEQGICCKASDMPYHDRLMKYMAEVNGNEKTNRNNN